MVLGNDSKKYSIIIRCYNEEKHLGKLLDGVFSQTILPSEVVIVDSGSTDRTVEIANSYNVTVVNIKKDEFSFGRALNLGLAATNSPYALIASAHVFPHFKTWAEMMLNHFQDPSVGIVYGKQRGLDSSYFSENQLFLRWFPDHRDLNQSHPFCNNANAMIRRQLWNQFPYDESLTGLEDLEFAKRIAQAQFKIVYEPMAVITHVHEETYRKIMNRYYRESLALKRIFPEEKFGKREFFHLLFKNLANDLSAAISQKALWTNLLPIIGFRVMQFIGTYKGFNAEPRMISELKERFYYPPDRTRAIDHPIPLDHLSIQYNER